MILGGGCAGLSLALRLAGRADAPRTLVLEAREGFGQDRTWCFWRTEPHRYDALVRHSWPAVALGWRGCGIVAHCPGTPYQMLEGAAFHAAAREAIAASQTVRLLEGVAALGEPDAFPGGWQVNTSLGPVRARQVVDTRPVPGTPALLWQSFLGEEVECERPAFDPGVAGLMLFTEAEGDGVPFRYVLPVSPHRALVEMTVFGPDPLPPAALRARQAEAVAELCKGPARVVRTEAGVLPMGQEAPAPTGPGWVRAGLAGGAARPSTGYAFQRIQRWAEACAASVLAGGPVLPHSPDPPAARAMDRLFLRVLRRHPARAPDLFLRLFGMPDPLPVIRFLSDQGTAADMLRIGAALPVPLFVGEALRAAAGPAA